MKKIIKIIFLTLLSINMYNCQQKNTIQEKITPKEMASWLTFDKGKTTIEGDVLIVEEVEGSDGYFLISPKIYPKDFTLTYKVKAMSESTVLINLFSVLQDSKSDEFLLPPVISTPSEVWQWRSSMQHYNLTFNNRSHGITPFFFKNSPTKPRGFDEKLKENIVEVGAWYVVEIGKKDNRIWFKLNNKLIFDVEDKNPFEGGRLIFRISGTTGKKVIFAKAALKDIMILYQ